MVKQFSQQDPILLLPGAHYNPSFMVTMYSHVNAGQQERTQLCTLSQQRVRGCSACSTGICVVWFHVAFRGRGGPASREDRGPAAPCQVLAVWTWEGAGRREGRRAGSYRGVGLCFHSDALVCCRCQVPLRSPMNCRISH